MICFDIKPLYLVKSQQDRIHQDMWLHNFIDGRRGNTNEHVVRFLDSMGAHANDKDLCLREFFKLLVSPLHVVGGFKT